MRRVKRIHFVGIGGAGMGGIAEVLHTQGFVVSGSDLQENAMTRRLKSLGVDVYKGHKEEWVKNTDAVVVSSAIDDSNIEIKSALERFIPVVPRAEMLSELMRFKFGIAVAGTHGKTTTTSMIASLLSSGGLDPTFIIGGKVKSFSSNAQLGKGHYIVAEADESDGSFLYLQPIIAVITNVDQDHLENYENNAHKLEQAFVEFVHHVPFYGLVIVCVDDPVIKRLLPQFTRPILTYGFDETADIKGSKIECVGSEASFVVTLKGESYAVETSCSGRHNVLNALAAIAVASEVGLKPREIIAGMKGFMGIQRRFDLIGNYAVDKARDILVIDDYAHHPREVEAIFEAIRSGWNKRRLVVVFQPHRYSRTRDLFEDFVRVLSGADVLVISDIYAAGEKEIAGIDSRTLCDSIRQRSKVDPIFIGEVEDVTKELPSILLSDDVLLFIGAGDIANAVEVIKDEWQTC